MNACAPVRNSLLLRQVLWRGQNDRATSATAGLTQFPQCLFERPSADRSTLDCSRASRKGESVRRPTSLRARRYSNVGARHRRVCVSSNDASHLSMTSPNLDRRTRLKKIRGCSTHRIAAAADAVAAPRRTSTSTHGDARHRRNFSPIHVLDFGFPPLKSETEQPRWPSLSNLCPTQKILSIR